MLIVPYVEINLNGHKDVQGTVVANHDSEMDHGTQSTHDEEGGTEGTWSLVKARKAKKIPTGNRFIKIN
jgi:hypothetical protein